MQPVSREDFGTTHDGRPVARYTLTNRRGSRACLMTYGATLLELWVPDRAGGLGDVVLGFETLAEYERAEAYIGCTIGRVANRIAGARFTLGERGFDLTANEGRHHLHGGERGFDRVVWAGAESDRTLGPAVRFAYRSPDGEEGYPGNLDVSVTYRLDDRDRLQIDYVAEADAVTPVNLTNHTYWNLAGTGDILGHTLRLHADRYTEVDEELIPTGRILPVADTPLDFTRPRPIGREISRGGPGYDHNFVLADRRRRSPAVAAELHDPISGRRMALSTTEPGLQLYTANHLDGLVGKAGVPYRPRSAVCLEAQGFPDAIHQPGFPSVLIAPGERYVQTTVFRFSSD